ncbi:MULTISPECIES: hypothetical protein [Streptococcus]|uniref:hypothetical protein n=1 Tax=Streptococcus TaxID=1301 RepID=UPI0013015772|nr:MULTISPECIES: hypothetical protein [Streptococcus]
MEEDGNQLQGVSFEEGLENRNREATKAGGKGTPSTSFTRTSFPEKAKTKEGLAQGASASSSSVPLLSFKEQGTFLTMGEACAI